MKKVFIASVLAIFASCGMTAFASGMPTITKVVPNDIKITTSTTTKSDFISPVISVVGTGFTSAGNNVFLNGGLAAVASSTAKGTRINFRIPKKGLGVCVTNSDGAESCTPASFSPGSYALAITNASGTSASVQITLSARGESATSTRPKPNQGPIFSVSCSASPLNPKATVDTVTWTAVVTPFASTTDTSKFTYLWTDGLGKGNPVVAKKPYPVSGTRLVSVTVTNPDARGIGATAHANCSVGVERKDGTALGGKAPVVISCSPFDSNGNPITLPVAAKSKVIWTATTAPAGSYYYLWRGTTGLDVKSSASTNSASYSVPGGKMATVLVKEKRNGPVVGRALCSPAVNVLRPTKASGSVFDAVHSYWDSVNQ